MNAEVHAEEATDTVTAGTAAAAALAAVTLAACGSGGEPAAGDPDPPPGPLTREQASRVLAQGAFGGTASDIENVRTLGRAEWIARQFAMPRSTGHVAWMRELGYDAVDAAGDPIRKNSDRDGVERSMWRKLISSPDVLRQRVVLALSEIFVISIIPVLLPWRGFACAAFVDLLEEHAFGNYGELLTAVSTNPAMARYLSFLNNDKADPATGREPDENYARELIQLFSLGVLQLNPNGTPVLENDVPKETYTQQDVTQLARVFTGWRLDPRATGPTGAVTSPLVQVRNNHERGSKVFLGTTIPPGIAGEESLRRAIATLMAHPNIGPFIGRQLIQRLVCSDPSPKYVERVAAAFDGGGQRARGDMKATITAILTDPEAVSDAGLTNPAAGKLREPVLRFLQWARTFGLVSANDSWNVGNLIDPASELAQSPLRSPSVFNFFRPGYVPPNTALGAAGITAPEFQITTESSVAGYLNFMQSAIAFGIGGMRADYSALEPLVDDSAALLAEVNVLLAAGQLSAATLEKLRVAIDTIPVGNPFGRRSRIHAALLLVLASPEYLVQK